MNTFISPKKVDNNWTQAKLMPSPINTEKSTSALYLSADGQYLLSSMVNNDKNIGPLGRGIFESYKKEMFGLIHKYFKIKSIQVT